MSKIGRKGGLVALNGGEITNSYSVMKNSGGNAGENLGEISQCFYSGNSHNKVELGDFKNSYHFHTSDKFSHKAAHIKHAHTVEKKEHANELGFDTENIWEHIGGHQVLQFISDNWLFDVKNSANYETKKSKSIAITTAEELFVIAEKINSGDKELAGAYICLDEDVDLKGKNWTPIGTELAKSFNGIFDGNGHTIKNFVIDDKNKKIKAKGFFGFLKGEVYNLSVEGVIKGEATAVGGIAAYCEKGIIGCCGAVLAVHCHSGDIGGIAGSNTGKIFHSYSAGTISSYFLRLDEKWLLPIAALLCISVISILLLGKGLNNDIEELAVFAPVPNDVGIEKLSDNTDPKSGKNFISIQFERKIAIDLETGTCVFNFMNPSSSNQNAVIQLQLTDENAVKIMGSTGRTDENQRKLDNNPQYVPENYRTVIAESGSVPPGYKVEKISLTSQPNGAKLKKGEYSAIVYLNFYDTETNNKAMTDSQFPVTITVN